jgi:hypothetical protein
VISDRMHVLVLAALCGALPVELVPRPTAKISAAFATIGVTDITLDATAGGADELRAFLTAQLERADEMSDAVDAASARLGEIETVIRDAVRKARA